jgi:hypothetical protein
MTKLEEIARAICTARERNGGPPWEYWLHEPGGKHVINAFMDDARAAVEAMRVPTAAQCKAADALEDQDWRDKGEREDGAAHWAAMIDAILNEKPGT